MAQFEVPELFGFQELPEYREFQNLNPGSSIDAVSAATNFGRAIHWLSFFKVLWPDFKTHDTFRVEVGYLVINDPRESELPEVFYEQLCKILETFWRMQLSDLYPNGDWQVRIWDDPEHTVTARIFNRNDVTG